MEKKTVTPLALIKNTKKNQSPPYIKATRRDSEFINTRQKRYTAVVEGKEERGGNSRAGGKERTKRANWNDKEGEERYPING